MTDLPAFTCPDCRMTSHNPNDAANSYCGNCHAYKFQWGPGMDPRCMEPGCPAFGDYGFGGQTCPIEHAIPPTLR